MNRVSKAQGFWEQNSNQNSWKIPLPSTPLTQFRRTSIMKNTKENLSSRNFVRKRDSSKSLWELQSRFWFYEFMKTSWVDGCDKNADCKIRWFLLSEKNVLKWRKLILQYWLKKILLQLLKVRFFKIDSFFGIYQKEKYDFWCFSNAPKLQI